MGYGVKGWRLDVADELPSKFIEELKSETLKLDKESILVGEVWEDASNKISYDERRKYLLGDQLNGVTGYVFKNIFVDFLNYKIDSNDVYNSLMTIKENYPKESFKSNLNILGTHDTRRILTELHEEKELLKLAVAIQMTFEGVPYIYYGDEAGLTGGKDPDNRKTFPWGKEDKAIFYMYKKMVSIRNENEELIDGDIEFISSEEDILLFRRRLNNKYLYIAINRNLTEEKEVILPEKSKVIYRKDLITNIRKPIINGKLGLKPLEGVILE